MRQKHLAGMALCVALLVTLAPAPISFAQTKAAPAIENTAPAATVQNGITLTKTAVPAGAGAWDVTLTATGGGTQQLTQPVDIVLLLDCTQSMAAPAVNAAITAQDAGDSNAAQTGKTTTRIAMAKSAARTFLDALSATGVPARVGVVGYGGKAETLLQPTALASKEAAVYNAVGNIWQTAYGPADLCYGGSGVNLERAFTAAAALMRKSSAAQRYVVVLGSGQPSAYGASGYSCVVPPTDAYFASEGDVQAATRTAADAVRDAGATCVFTIGVGTDALSSYASLGAGVAVPPDALSSALCNIAAQLSQRVQSPVITDVLGDGFVVAKNSLAVDVANIAQQGEADIPAPQAALLSADGRTIEWGIGAFLPQGQRATLRYTARLADAAYVGAGTAQPLGDAVLRYTAPQNRGAPRVEAVNFPVPTVRYDTGTLRVSSVGLPAHQAGTAQTVGNTLVSSTAHFAVQRPAIVQGWALSCVTVDGVPYQPTRFATLTGYRLPVRVGCTTVEYSYVPAPDIVAQWHYTVRYYRDGLQLPDTTYTGTVPAAAPVVDSVPNRLTALPDCYENPICALPRTLQADDEEIRVDYLTIPRDNAQVNVKHVYYEDKTDGPIVGTRMTTSPDTQDAHVVRELFMAAYGGRIYMPVQVTLLTWPRAGAAQGDAALCSGVQSDGTQSGTPQSGTPQGGVPQGGTPQGGTPQGGVPQGSTPQSGTSQNGVPQSGTPQSSIPQGGTPQGSIPQSGTPQSSTPQSSTPQNGTPQTTAQQKAAQPPTVAANSAPSQTLAQSLAPVQPSSQPAPRQPGAPVVAAAAQATNPVSQVLSLGDSFLCEANTVYTLEIRYVPLFIP